MKSLSIALIAFAAATAGSNGQVLITEYSYKGIFGQYFEVSNLGLTAVSLNGWRFNNNEGTHASGVALPNVTLGSNETVIVTEVSAEVFALAWYEDTGEGTPATLKAYVQNNTRNFEDADEIRLYNSSGTAVDIVAVNTSIWDTEDRPLVRNAARTGWVFADTIVGSWKAGAPGANGPVGNPGVLLP